jgi:hypothetical protein
LPTQGNTTEEQYSAGTEGRRIDGIKTDWDRTSPGFPRLIESRFNELAPKDIWRKYHTVAWNILSVRERTKCRQWLGDHYIADLPPESAGHIANLAIDSVLLFSRYFDFVMGGMPSSVPKEGERVRSHLAAKAVAKDAAISVLAARNIVVIGACAAKPRRCPLRATNDV